MMAYMLYRGGLLEKGIFFRLQVYERVGILLVEEYNKVGKSVIWVKGPKRANRWILWLYKVEKTFWPWLFKRLIALSTG